MINRQIDAVNAATQRNLFSIVKPKTHWTVRKQRNRRIGLMRGGLVGAEAHLKRRWEKRRAGFTLAIEKLPKSLQHAFLLDLPQQRKSRSIQAGEVLKMLLGDLSQQSPKRG